MAGTASYERADLAPALALAEKYGIALELIDGERLHWRWRGPTAGPGA